VVLDGGRVVEQGSPAEMRRRSGAYRRLERAYEGDE
jgi:ABC-type multidrug transport system fused ATPase/permease subunit